MTKEIINVEIVTIPVQQLEAILDAKIKLVLDAISQANSKSNSDEWFDLKGLIAYLPSHPQPQTIYHWIYKKLIPFHKTPGSKTLVFLRTEIDDWLKTGRRKTQSEKVDFVKNYLNKKP